MMPKPNMSASRALGNSRHESHFGIRSHWKMDCVALELGFWEHNDIELLPFSVRA
jgi:hypothetical protein